MLNHGVPAIVVREEVGEGQDFDHRGHLRTFDPWHTDLSSKANQRLVYSNSIVPDCTQAPKHTKMHRKMIDDPT